MVMGRWQWRHVYEWRCVGQRRRRRVDHNGTCAMHLWLMESHGRTLSYLLPTAISIVSSPDIPPPLVSPRTPALETSPCCILFRPCLRLGFVVMVWSQHIDWTEPNWTATSRPSYITRSFIGHARRRHDFIGCGKIRNVSAQSVLNTCIPMRLFTLEFAYWSPVQSSSVKPALLWTRLGYRMDQTFAMVVLHGGKASSSLYIRLFRSCQTQLIQNTSIKRKEI